MQVNEAALGRLTHSRMNGVQVAAIFKLLAQAAEIAPKDATLSMTLRYQQPADEIKEGDLFPCITLSLQPFNGKPVATDSGDAPGATGDQPVS
jgi:hypothetical protein